MLNKLRKTSSYLSAVIFLGSWTFPVYAADVNLIVTGITQMTGQVRAALFDKAESFPNRLTDSVQRQAVAVTTGEAALTFSGVVAGTYAIAVFHDANNNGVLDRNFAGIPTELYGFSNNARSTLGSPRFAQAAFTVEEENVEVEIDVK
ncbi:DUF2141 domain-containing protein [Thioflexithrix psekupsensis]|uniref:DUF2141 domain-containing protein n=1 Tax=Thioflexithrix psekupsensis TaxID=1570016 RepID=UPI000A3815BD|nr:DUF2141 domain-containing protein [Thioflexithrix psekupsensis]